MSETISTGPADDFNAQEWDQRTGEFAPELTDSSTDDESAVEGDRTAVDDAIDAQLSSDAVEKLVDAATIDLVKKTLEKATRMSVARSLSPEQIERIHQSAAAAVATRFPHADDSGPSEGADTSESADDSSTRHGPVTAAQHTRKFLSWMQSFLPTIESKLAKNQDYVWCPTWWEHPEAVGRLKALWQAWEGAQIAKDQRAVSTWWTDHWDRHLPTLLAERGPFRDCAISHHPQQSIPYGPPPATFTIPAPPPPPAPSE